MFHPVLPVVLSVVLNRLVLVTFAGQELRAASQLVFVA